MKLFSILVLIIPPGVLVASKTKKSLVFLAKKCAALNPQIPDPIITVLT